MSSAEQVRRWWTRDAGSPSPSEPLSADSLVTIGPIYDVTQIVEDPHILERELLADYPDAEMGQFPMHHVVPRLMATPGSIRTPAPRLGQHNRELLRQVGVGSTDLDPDIQIIQIYRFQSYP